MRVGLIVGGGRFPLLVASSAKQQGHEVVAVAIKEEAAPEIEDLANRCHWVSLGELTKLIKHLKQEQITEVVMAGRVRHARIFSSIRPDWKLLKLLTSLPRKNTDALLGALANVLAEEGIELVDSTRFLEPNLVQEGPLTQREPSEDERADIEYGREVAAALVAYDIGQTVVICERACVAAEAMEGTNDVIVRAGELSNGRPLTVVKMAKPNQDMRFDVPVIGSTTIEKMQQANATALAVQAGKTLMLDKEETIAAGDRAKISIVGYRA